MFIRMYVSIYLYSFKQGTFPPGVVIQIINTCGIASNERVNHTCGMASEERVNSTLMRLIRM